MKISLCALLIALALAGFHERNAYNPDPVKHLGIDPKEVNLTVHLVSHSHDDLGWLKTVDQYYSGSGDMIRRAGVIYILDTVIDGLLRDETKRFTQVEMGFFEVWYNEQTEEMREQVKMLVSEERLQFVGGGWSMEDEACADYEGIITNMERGHSFLKSEFGYEVKTAWQIDPFGHSRAQAHLFREMGIENLMFARIDYRDKQQRREDQELEFFWQPYESSESIFTSVFYDMYWGLPGFDFDDYWDEDWGDQKVIVDDESLDTYNLSERVEDFAQQVSDLSIHFKTDQIFVPLGTDFSYQNAEWNWLSSDRLIEHMSEYFPNIEVKYSTPDTYLNAVKACDAEFSNYTGDFMNYADDEQSYWTGFYTSRANLKQAVREAERQLVTLNQLQSLAYLKGEEITPADFLVETISLLQHHDGVTGTARQHVADDYQERLYRAIEETDELYSETLNQVLGSDQEWQSCHRTNATYLECAPDFGWDDDAATVRKYVAVAIFNPSFQSREKDIVSMKVAPGGSYTLRLGSEVIDADLICEDFSNDDAEYIQACQIYWIVPEMDPLETVVYNMSQAFSSTADNGPIQPTFVKAGETVSLKTQSNEEVIMEHDEESVTFHQGESKVIIEYRYYNSYDSDIEGDQQSGPYIFRTDDTWSQLWSENLDVRKYSGKVIEMVSVKGTTVDYQALMKPDADGIEFDLFSNVKGLPGDKGREVTLTLKSNIVSNKEFYTDSNGLGLEKRVLDERTFPFSNEDEWATSNYYPINSIIQVRDEASNKSLSLHNDRSQGGSSLTPGGLELMVQRRVLRDDDRGMEEPLNETLSNGLGERVYTHHFVSLKDHNDNDQIEHLIRFTEPLRMAYGKKPVLVEGFSPFSLFKGTFDIRLSFKVDGDSLILRALNIGKMEEKNISLSGLLDTVKQASPMTQEFSAKSALLSLQGEEWAAQEIFSIKPLQTLTWRLRKTLVSE